MHHRRLLADRTLGARGLFAAGAVVAYLLGYVLLQPRVGAGAAALSAVPVVAIGWARGMLAGVLAGVLSFPLNTLLLNATAHPPHGWDAVIRAGGLPGSFALVLIGGAVGRLRDLEDALRRRLREYARVEQALRDREARLEMLVEQMPAVLWTTDEQLRFTSSVGAGLTHLGLRPGQVVGMSLAEYFQTADPHFPAIAAHRRALGGAATAYDMTWRERTYQAHVKPLRDPGGAPRGVIGVALDITERVQAERALCARDAVLDERVRELAAIADASAALRGAESMEDLASAIAVQATRLLGADVAFLHLRSEERGQLRIVAASEARLGAVGRYHGEGEGVTGLVLRTGQVYRTPHLAADPRVVHKDLVRGLGPAVCVPLRTSAGRVIGTLTLAQRERPAGDEASGFVQNERLLTTLAEIAGNALQRIRTHEALEDSYVQAVLALSNAMDARDTYTAHHSRRLAALANATARALGCGDDEVQDVHWGALLHDIGKLAVPDAILAKRGPLTAEEWALVKRHPEAGTRIVAPVRRFQPVLPIIRHHHERWDGTGYPDGLAGEAIPLGARILAVADAELCRHAGAQFDPQVVEVFCRVVAAEVACEDAVRHGPQLEEA